jgi:hypothetical protein
LGVIYQGALTELAADAAGAVGAVDTDDEARGTLAATDGLETLAEAAFCEAGDADSADATADAEELAGSAALAEASASLGTTCNGGAGSEIGSSLGCI